MANGAAARPIPVRWTWLGLACCLWARAGASCNQKNKQKAMYLTHTFSPDLDTQGAFDVIADVIWENLDGLRSYGNRGLYNAVTIGWPNPSPSGYLGPQATGADPDVGQVLFSLWDKSPGESAWQPALPLIPEVADPKAVPGMASCKRNCNDCGVHDGPTVGDGSTGTQCKVYIPAYTGQEVRLRLRRYQRDVELYMYGQTWTGDAWEVTVEDLGTGEIWLVGRQLLAGVNQGLNRVNAFYEHIGRANLLTTTRRLTLRRNSGRQLSAPYFRIGARRATPSTQQPHAAARGCLTRRALSS